MAIGNVMSHAPPQVSTVVDTLDRVMERDWFVCMYIQPSVARPVFKNLSD